MSKSRIAVVVLAAVALAIAYRLGVFQRLSSPSQVRQTFVELGAWGQVAFVVAYTVFQPFGVPGTVFVMAAPLIWPWPAAFALSMAGTMGASVVGFSFARFVARDWFARRVPPRIARYEAALERRAFTTVFVLRLVFWMPQWLHAFFGVSRVGFWTHFWGSLAGYAPPLFLMSYFGQRLFDFLQKKTPAFWVEAGLGTAVVALAVWLGARRLRRRAALNPALPGPIAATTEEPPD
jgi:uncharacterized membrane protein YdjX (TVP38/TMEM64 family)